jgi:sulfur carrier protein ThiS
MSHINARIAFVKVYIKLIATYREHLPPGTSDNITTVDVPDGSTVAEILTPFGIPLDDSSVIVLNGLTVDLNTPASEGDTISAFSAIAGG